MPGPGQFLRSPGHNCFLLTFTPQGTGYMHNSLHCLMFPSHKNVSSLVELSWTHRLLRELSHLLHCIDTKYLTAVFLCSSSQSELESIQEVLGDYRDCHGTLIKWIEETTAQQERMKPGQAEDSRVLSEQLSQQTVGAAVAQWKLARAGGQFIIKEDDVLAVKLPQNGKTF